MKNSCRVATLFCIAFAEADVRITPALHPASDKQFMGKDYPDDGRPFDVSKQKFGYPYPSVQKSNDFDRDYVKDENNDNGEWQAQMHYDMIRAAVRRAKEELARVEGMSTGEKALYDKAFQKALAAGHSVEEANKKALEAANKYAATHAEEIAEEKKAEEARKKANGQAGADVDRSDVDAAKKELQKEELQFKECEKQFEQAKLDLQKAIDEQAAHEKEADENGKKQKQDLEKEAEKDEQEADKLKSQEAGLAADEKASTDSELKLEEEEKKLAGLTANQKKAYELKHMSVEEAHKYVDKVWKQLAAAEARLKCFRRHGTNCPSRDTVVNGGLGAVGLSGDGSQESTQAKKTEAKSGASMLSVGFGTILVALTMV